MLSDSMMVMTSYCVLFSLCQNLPQSVQQQHEDPSSSYNVGWSHGKEALADGKLDVCKGSYYANPMQDNYNVNEELAATYKSYYRPNIWPDQHLPDLQPAFKSLGQLIVHAGVQLTQHCNRWAAATHWSLGGTYQVSNIIVQHSIVGIVLTFCRALSGLGCKGFQCCCQFAWLHV